MSGRSRTFTTTETANLGSRVRQIRRENNWTLEDLSRKTGVSTSRCLNSRTAFDVTFETVMKLCEAWICLGTLGQPRASRVPVGMRTVTRRNEGLQLATQEYGFEVLCSDIAKKACFRHRDR